MAGYLQRAEHPDPTAGRREQLCVDELISSGEGKVIPSSIVCLPFSLKLKVQRRLYICICGAKF